MSNYRLIKEAVPSGSKSYSPADSFSEILKRHGATGTIKVTKDGKTFRGKV